MSLPAFLVPLLPPTRRARHPLPSPVSPRRRPPPLAQALPPADPPPTRLAQPENVVLRDLAHDHLVLAASRTVRTIPEMTAHILHLRHQRLSLLLADLAARVRCEKPGPAVHVPLRALLADADALAARLVVHDADSGHAHLRAQIRHLLWELRLALDPLSVSEALRTSLEVARSSFLDIPRDVGGGEQGGGEASEALVRGEMYALMVENVLLEELRSLRVLERQMNDAVARWHPRCVEQELAVAAAASASLGLDDYRVRGKTRLADAVADVRRGLEGVREVREVREAIDILHHALVQSLETDLKARRPAGVAMLLRPRMDDIPNFAVVGENILRGGQPSSRGLEWLRNYGVSLVIDLRGSDRENQWEIPKCRLLRTGGSSAGEEEGIMRFCNIPVEDFSTPDVEQVFDFVQMVNAIAAKSGVVFVHCKAGIGRTGTFVACWRIFHGEDADEALAKESLYSEGGGGLRQEEFVRDFWRLHAQRKGVDGR